MEVGCLCRQPENKVHYSTPSPSTNQCQSDVKVCNAEDAGGTRSDSTIRGKDTCKELIPWYDHGSQQDLITQQTTGTYPSKRKPSTIKFYFQ